MSHFPLFMTMKERPALVVGGDELAARKIRLLQKASARIHVMASSLCCELREKVDAVDLVWLEGDLPLAISNSYAFVVSATDDEFLDRQVADLARKANVPVNVVDRPEISDFIFPAIIDRSPVMVAVSSGGTAPVLARRIRAQIEALLPANLGKLAVLSEKFRNAVKSLFPTERSRRLFWERYFDGEAVQNFLSGDEENAQERLLAAVNDLSNGKVAQGKAIFIHADVENPDLLSIRAYRHLQNADLILSDIDLANPIVDLARRDSERLHVGKVDIAPSLINRLTADAVEKGQIVIRLISSQNANGSSLAQELDHLNTKNLYGEVMPSLHDENNASLPNIVPTPLHQAV